MTDVAPSPTTPNGTSPTGTSPTGTARAAAGNPSAGSRGGGARQAGLTAPPRLRRRPVFLVVGVLAVALGALITSWLVTRVGHAQPVVAVREAVDRGEVITEQNLMTVSISVDPALKVIAAAQLPSVVGQRATVDLPAGGLVVQGSFDAQPLPVAGQSLVGVWLAPGQLPGQPLRSGDRVRVVATPRQQESLPDQAPTVLAATVVSTSVSPDGHSLVTVSVPTPVAPQLSALVATGRIALVLDSAAR